jgi:hypothetical protein
MSVQDTTQDVTQQADDAQTTQNVQDQQVDNTDASQQTQAADDQNQQQDNADNQQDRDEQGRFKKGVQPRIDELTRARREAEREAAYWRARATAGQTNQEQAQSPAPAATPKPTPDQFDDHGAYIEALTDWKAEQAVLKHEATKAEEAAAKAKAQEAATKAKTWEERQGAARTAMPDYDDVVGNSDTPVAQHVIEALLESENGPGLVYHLAKNPEVAERLNGMSPLAAARELGKIEVSLQKAAAAGQGAANGEQGAPQKQAKEVSKAPTPVKPLGSGRATPVDLANASMDDYIAQRKTQGATWAR